MADVGDEVTPGGFHAGIVGLVVHESDGEPAVFLAQQAGLPVHRQSGSAAGTLRRQQVEFNGVPAQRLLGGLPGLVVELVVADQAQFLRPVVEIDHVAMGVDHRRPHRHQSDDALQHLRDGDSRPVGGRGLATLCDPPRQPNA